MIDFSINGRKIGPQYPPYIIAELSGNHNGSLDRALESIEVAATMGADAVKIQSYTADTMTIDCDAEDFRIEGGLWDGYRLYDLYKWAYTPFEWHEALFAKARELGITLFSTPFDESAIDLLESLDTPAYKIASFELLDLPLIEKAARTGKPLIMSTGMATLEEITEAVHTARSSGCRELALLHCISGYPSPVDEANLSTIADLYTRFECTVGLSDHTLGTLVPVASLAFGTSLIEKHFTLSKADKGPDSEFSLEPHELQTLCREALEAWKALGNAGYDMKPAEEASVKFRRSIYFVRDMKAGDIISKECIRRIRPGYGLPPKYFDELIGKKVKRNIDRGTATAWELIDE